MIVQLLKNTKVISTVVIAIASVVAALVLRNALRKPDVVQETVYSRMEEVKHIRHLELVTYYFESMVDVTHMEKSDKVYLLMIIPARISCYINLEQMHYEITDSLVHIYLPDPMIETPVLNLDSARIFNMNQRYVTASKKSYETVLRNVQRSLIRAKQDVLKRAMANGIRSEASRLGEIYFQGLFAGLGYHVEFIKVEPKDASGLAASIPEKIQDLRE